MRPVRRSDVSFFVRHPGEGPGAPLGGRNAEDSEALLLPMPAGALRLGPAREGSTAAVERRMSRNNRLLPGRTLIATMFDLKPANSRPGGGLKHNILWSAPAFRPLPAASAPSADTDAAVPGGIGRAPAASQRTGRTDRANGPGERATSSRPSLADLAQTQHTDSAGVSGSGGCEPPTSGKALAPPVSDEHQGDRRLLPLLHRHGSASRPSSAWRRSAVGHGRSAQRARLLASSASLRHSSRLSVAPPPHSLCERA